MREALKKKDSKQEQYSYLLSYVKRSTEKCNQREKLERAFAQVMLYIYKFYSDPKEALQLLKDARRVFHDFSEENRKLRIFEKDVYLISGNFLHSQGEFNKAIEAYQLAIVNEHNFDRKCRAYLNIARVYQSCGYLYKAIRVSEKLVLSKITDPKLFDYSVLLRSRINLMLGFEKDALDILDNLGKREKLSPAVELEFRYLKTMGEISFEQPRDFLSKYEGFCKWITGMFDESTCLFYEFEFKLFQLLIEPSKIKNKNGFKARIRYLAQKAGSEKFKSIGIDLAEYILNMQFSDKQFNRLKEALFEMVDGANHIFFQIVLLLFMDFLLQNRKYTKVANLLEAFRIYRSSLELGFSEKILNQIKKRPSNIQIFVKSLSDRLPQGNLDCEENVGVSLLQE